MPSALLAALACALLGPGQAIAAPRQGVGPDAWWYQSMHLSAVHQISTGRGVTVAVIDGPVDPGVPDLHGQDVVPVANFCGGSATGSGAVAAHGTSTVVKIAGSGRGTAPGGVGVAGVAPDAKVLTYADTNSAAGDQCRTTSPGKAMGAAIDRAIADHARIISTSDGGAAPDPDERAAVQRALDAGVVVVAAAGNAPYVDSVVYPAAYPGVVAVAAVDRDDRPWDGNVAGNRNAFVISAPGVRVETGSFVNDQWTSEAQATGTSDAAPLVAGSLALLAARYPGATGNQLIQDLIHNPDGDRQFGFDPEYGYGVVSPQKMLAADPTHYPDVNPLLTAAVTAAPAAHPPVPGPATLIPIASTNGRWGLPLWVITAGAAAAAAAAAGVLISRGRPGAGRPDPGPLRWTQPPHVDD